MLLSMRVGWSRVEDVERLRSHFGRKRGEAACAFEEKHDVCIPRTIGTVMLEDLPFLQSIPKYMNQSTIIPSSIAFQIATAYQI